MKWTRKPKIKKNKGLSYLTMTQIAKMGGDANIAKYGKKHMSDIAKLSHLNRQAPRMRAKEGSSQYPGELADAGV